MEAFFVNKRNFVLFLSPQELRERREPSGCGCSDESESLIKNALKSVGKETEDCKMLVERMDYPHGSAIFVTIEEPEVKPIDNACEDTYLLLRLPNLSAVIGASEASAHLTEFPKTRLYHFDGGYYITVLQTRDTETMQKLCNCICEFGHLSTEARTLDYLFEHGELLLDGNAMETLIRNFKA